MWIRCVLPLAILAALSAPLATSASETAGPGAFESPDGDFRVTFPTDPVKRVEGSIVHWEAHDVELEYRVTRRPIEGVKTAEGRLGVFDAVIKSLTDSGYRILEQKRVPFGAHHVPKVVMAGPPGKPSRAEGYLIGNRVYSLVVSGPPGKDLTEVAQKFFGSFEVERK